MAWREGAKRVHAFAGAKKQFPLAASQAKWAGCRKKKLMKSHDISYFYTNRWRGGRGTDGKQRLDQGQQ